MVAVRVWQESREGVPLEVQPNRGERPMSKTPATADCSAGEARKPRVSRHQEARQRGVVRREQDSGSSERLAAKRAGVARGTWRHWARRAEAAGVPSELSAFLETPEGVEWLRRVVASAHWCISELGGSGVRVVCEFLQLSGLSAFVGASYGSQQAFQARLEEQIVACAAEQRAALAAAMPARTITVAEDETWLGPMSLVAIEPVSNFILLEQFAPDRSAATWSRALEAAMVGLNVTVIQGTSDEAKGLVAHIQRDLGAHHVPDLFHLQHEVAKGTGLALARTVRQAQAHEVAAEASWQQACDAEQAYHQQRHGPGRPPALAQRIEQARQAWETARHAHQQTQERQQQAKALIGALGDAIHPYDLEHAQVQSPAVLGERLGALFQSLETLVEEAGLGARARASVAKAKRLTGALMTTLAFFLAGVNARVECLHQPPAIEQAMRTALIPALYLERLAARAPQAEARQHHLALRARLLAPLRQPTHPIQALEADTRALLEQVAGECADLFQRSSSCVEGRNGQLSLHQHGRHRLSPRSLAALTAVHNFHLRRPDGSTAAERFFGHAHEPLFDQVLQRLPWPARPAQRRPRPPKPPRLALVAA